MLALQYQFAVPEAGVDEAGRGCLAGPVVAAAVLLPSGFSARGLNDSKKLCKKERERLAFIIKQEALAWAVAQATVEEIGTLNILHASLLAMQRAVLALAIKPELLLIDGNRFTPLAGYAHRTEIKGDGRFANIAAASVLAKTHRDGLMAGLAVVFPAYGFERHKGYPTKMHRAAIAQVGPCALHRPGFRLLPDTVLLR